MSVPGDIDLTQNLDFRKTVRKELPQLPDSWKGNSNKLVCDNTFITTLSSNTISLDTHTGTYSAVNNINTNIRINSPEITDWNNSYYGDEIQDITIRQDSMTISYNIANTNDYITNIYYYDNNNHNWTSNKNKIVSISFKEQEEKYDVFGNKIKPPKEIPRIPWEGKENKLSCSNRRIAWKKNMYYRDYLSDDYIDPIAWERAEAWGIKNKQYDLYDNIERAQNLISWLFNKSRNTIRKYFEEDEVDLSYLTNMGWIRVRDAIID